MNFLKIFLVLAIILGLLYLFRWSRPDYEGFNPWLDYSRVYPGIFSYRNIPYHDWSYNTDIPMRYNSGYSKYWYIPALDYLNTWINSPNYHVVHNNCTVPPIISEYCFNHVMQQTGDIDSATNSCTIPASISESCLSFMNRTDPLTYHANDYLTLRDINC